MIPDIVHIFCEMSGSLFGLICHQDPSLLIRVDGAPILLCPRCIGLHTSFLTILLLVTVISRGHTIMSRSAFLSVITPALIAMPIHWLCVGARILPPDPVVKLVTGSVAGAAMGILAAAYVTHLHVIRGHPIRRMGIARTAFLIGLGGLPGWAIILAGGHTQVTLWLLTCICANVIVLTLIALNRIRSLWPVFHYPQLTSRKGWS